MPRLDILRIRGFRDLWLGQAISQAGDSLYFVIFMFMVEKLTGSIAMVGYVDAVAAIPFLLFGPVAGVVADRMDRRTLMLLSDLCSGALLLLFGAIVFLSSSPPVWTLFAAPFLLSTMRVFFLPAKSAAIPGLVPTSRLMEANALSATTQNMMPLIGLAISASVLALLYSLSPTLFFGLAIVANGASFLGSAMFILRLPSLVPKRDPVEGVHPFADLVSGLRYIRSRHVLMALLGLSVLLSLAISPFFVVYIASNKAWFGGFPQTLAWFEFAFFLGMIAGSMGVARWNVRRPGLGYSFGLLGVGLAVAGMAWSRSFAGFFALNVLAGVALPFAQIPVAVYLQSTVPDAYLGRVNSVLSTFGIGAMPLGMAMGGVLVERAGIVNAFAAMGGSMALLALLALVDRPFRESSIPSHIPAAAEEPADAPA